MRISRWFGDLEQNPKKASPLLFRGAAGLFVMEALLLLLDRPRLEAAEASELLSVCLVGAFYHALITLLKPGRPQLDFDFSPASVQRLDVVVLVWLAPFFLARIVGGLL